MTNIIPVTFRIIVDPENIEDKDEAYQAAKRIAGFEIVGKTKDREQAAVDKGVVVSFGPTVFVEYGCENPLQIGDTIVYARHSGKEIEDPVTKHKYVAINDADVVAVLKKEA